MHHAFRAAFALAALLCVPVFAHAGPVRWGYRAEAPDGTVLAERSGITELAWGDFFLPDPRVYGTPVPDPIPNNSVRTDIWRSQATVTIIDELSGLSGELDLYLDYRQQYEIRSDGSLEPIYEGTIGGPWWPDAGVLTLGGNTYSVRSPGGEFMVEVTPGPASATPEPGSLALAGCGLGAVFVRRLRRVRRGAAVALLACAALFGSTGVASAGPIEWSMRSDPDYTRFGTNFYFGTADRPLPEPGGGTEVVHIYGTMPEGLLPVGAGSQSNILLATHSKQSYWYDYAPPSNPAATNQVPYIVWVTDHASGESGFLKFDLSAYYLTGLPTTDYGEVVFGGSGGGSLVLGGNRYDLEFNTSDGDEGTYITANLTVAPVAATPEPGSLALAGFGLVAVLAPRLRRVTQERVPDALTSAAR